jgi:serine/threonine protein kinase
LGGAVDTNEPNWEKQYRAINHFFNQEELQWKGNPDKYKEQMAKAHIFQLGTTLFFLAKGEYPYQCDPIGYVILERKTNFILQALSDTFYSEQQTKIIASMLDPNPRKRPSIEDVASIFPPSLIFNHNVQDV